MNSEKMTTTGMYRKEAFPVRESRIMVEVEDFGTLEGNAETTVDKKSVVFTTEICMMALD